MSRYSYPFGHRYNWVGNPARLVCETDSHAKQGIDQDSGSPKSAERAIVQSAIVKKLKGKLKTAELVAMLPQCESPSRSIDEICAETLALIDLLDSDSEL